MENNDNNYINIQENFDSSDSKEKRLHKAVATAVIVIALACFNNIQTGAFTTNPECLYDFTFEMSHGVYEYVRDHVPLRNAILILAGLFEDICVIVGLVFFAVYFKSWRLLFALASLYLSRAIIQQIYIMTIPKEMIFQYPGFPSLFVPYLPTNDFFFSGHVSLPTIIAHEFALDKRFNKIAYFAYFTAIFEALMMIIMRGHYGMDIFAGFIFSFYFIRITDMYIKSIDTSKMGMFYIDKQSNEGEYNKTDIEKQ